MAFFVPESKGQSNKNDEVDGRIDLSLLALGKKIGLSFLEINELRSSDLIELAKCFSGTNEEKPKEATQEDIDNFFG